MDGGSSVTYNYNGIAYNGTGGVNPRTMAIYIDTLPSPTSISIPVYPSTSFPTFEFPMDLRGYAATIPGFEYYIAGGMKSNQQVTDQVLRLIPASPVGIENFYTNNEFHIFPNPTSEQINIRFKKLEKRTIQLIDILGNEILNFETSEVQFQLDVSNYPKGIYLVKVTSAEGSSSQKIIVQ